jgi:hypothetical protein
MRKKIPDKPKPRKESKKMKTLPDAIEVMSLKALLDAYGATIYKAPEKWLKGLNFAPDELAAYPLLARQLSPASLPKIVNFPQSAEQVKQAA